MNRNDWIDVNQRAMANAIGEIRGVLEAKLGRGTPTASIGRG